MVCAGACTGGTQLGFCLLSSMFCILAFDPSLRDIVSKFPGAWSFDTLGATGAPRREPRIPLAEARLLAMDEDSSRVGGWRRWGVNPGIVADGLLDTALATTSSLASAAPVCAAAFSPDSLPSFSAVACLTGCSTENLMISDSFWWCCSRSRRVRRASMLEVAFAALENSPAARVCSLTATVEFAVWAASDAAFAWSCA